MNQLDHLRALRDKARLQTEQAKSVLKQQGEITESLDRLIAALEESGAEGPVLAHIESSETVTDAQVAAPSPVGEDAQTLGQLISKLENGKLDAGGVDATRSGLEVTPSWQEEVPPPAPPPKPREVPALAPIVWEVSEASTSPTSTEEPAAATAEEPVPTADETIPPAGEEEALPPVPDDDEQGDFREEVAIPPSAAPLPAEPQPDTVTEEEEAPEVSSEEPPPAIPAAEEDEGKRLDIPAREIETSTEMMEPDESSPTGFGESAVTAAPSPEPVKQKEPSLPVTNIFFDANSAYLKESELEKILRVAETRTRRVVKVQGLEDLASSNDFKRLLASRRVLAITKKLGEAGIGTELLAVSDIKLSEEGRILSPPSVMVDLPS